jgi:hypothetical protein
MRILWWPSPLDGNLPTFLSQRIRLEIPVNQETTEGARPETPQQSGAATSEHSVETLGWFSASLRLAPAYTFDFPS